MNGVIVSGVIESRLKALGITLPDLPAPLGAYVPWVRAGHLVFISGQLPMVNGKPAQIGLVGSAVSVEDAKAAARVSGINLIAQLKAACEGDLQKVKRVVKLTGFVACDGTFTQHPHVINGASELFVEVFGEAGRHARAAVGSSSLPLGASVEVEGVFEVND